MGTKTREAHVSEDRECVHASGLVREVDGGEDSASRLYSSSRFAPEFMCVGRREEVVAPRLRRSPELGSERRDRAKRLFTTRRDERVEEGGCRHGAVVVCEGVFAFDASKPVGHVCVHCGFD